MTSTPDAQSGRQRLASLLGTDIRLFATSEGEPLQVFRADGAGGVEMFVLREDHPHYRSIGEIHRAILLEQPLPDNLNHRLARFHDATRGFQIKVSDDDANDIADEIVAGRSALLSLADGMSKDVEVRAERAANMARLAAQIGPDLRINAHTAFGRPVIEFLKDDGKGGVEHFVMAENHPQYRTMRMIDEAIRSKSILPDSTSQRIADMVRYTEGFFVPVAPDRVADLAEDLENGRHGSVSLDAGYAVSNALRAEQAAQKHQEMRGEVVGMLTKIMGGESLATDPGIVDALTEAAVMARSERSAEERGRAFSRVYAAAVQMERTGDPLKGAAFRDATSAIARVFSLDRRMNEHLCEFMAMPVPVINTSPDIRSGQRRDALRAGVQSCVRRPDGVHEVTVDVAVLARAVATRREDMEDDLESLMKRRESLDFGIARCNAAAENAFNVAHDEWLQPYRIKEVTARQARMELEENIAGQGFWKTSIGDRLRLREAKAAERQAVNELKHAEGVADGGLWKARSKFDLTTHTKDQEDHVERLAAISIRTCAEHHINKHVMEQQGLEAERDAVVRVLKDGADELDAIEHTATLAAMMFQAGQRTVTFMTKTNDAAQREFLNDLGMDLIMRLNAEGRYAIDLRDPDAVEKEFGKVLEQAATWDTKAIRSGDAGPDIDVLRWRDLGKQHEITQEAVAPHVG